MEKKRIFWLGMHKLLIATELKRLRILGYEVFNPPYLSSVIDQSAVLDWTPPPSTLPVEAITILSKTNFFYASIPPEAAEILNHYFKIAIVTINPDWLKDFLKVYHGKVIYRVYGQVYRLSEYMAQNQTIELLSEREDFWFCPHHEEALRTEDLWLKRLKTRVIPYCLSDDIVALANHWRYKDFGHAQASEYNHIGLICPRILDNDYYNHYYKLIKKHFSDDQFKIFGSQILPVSDPQVVGTLERETFLKWFSQLRGFIYHFKDPAVCYLPPIEFMTLGGPVIFLNGSLLSRYFSLSPPGEAKNFSALVKLAQRLKKGDHALIHEIIESQEEVRALYHPNTVWPHFDKSMAEMLSTNEVTPAPKLLYTINTAKNHSNIEKTEKFYLILSHKFGPNIGIDPDLNYYSPEGIVRVTRLMVQALTQHNNTVIVTSYRSDFGKIHGFFTTHISDFTQLKVLILEDSPTSTLKKASNTVRLSLKKIGVTKIIKTILLFLKIKPTFENIRLYFNFFFYLKEVSNSPYINTINQDKSIAQIIVPHYYLYPEVLSSIKPVLLYLPDYLPYFYKGSLEMGDHWIWRKIGKKIAKKANIVLTNSEFTRNYLPHCRLKVKKEKIIHIPLPYLPHTKIDKLTFSNIVKKLPDLFIFYPTRDRLSKRLNDFLEIVRVINHRLKIKNETKRIYGVLTTSLLNRKNTDKYVINLPTLSDLDLTQVYQSACALVFTSENEGNFPTQVNEALYLNTPVIATNIPQITLELGEISNFLQLVDVGDCEKFADAVLYTIDNREKVLIHQEKVRDYAKKYFSYDQFSSKFLEIFDKKCKPLTQEILR